MSKFKPGDIVTATRNPLRRAMEGEGFILGEIVKKLPYPYKTDLAVEGFYRVHVLACKLSHWGDPYYAVGTTIDREGCWFDLFK